MPSSGESTFSIGYCSLCQKDVLTHILLGPADEETHRCVHCDQVITALQQVGRDHLGAYGYVVVEPSGCEKGECCRAAACAGSDSSSLDR